MLNVVTACGDGLVSRELAGASDLATLNSGRRSQHDTSDLRAVPPKRHTRTPCVWLVQDRERPPLQVVTEATPKCFGSSFSLRLVLRGIAMSPVTRPVHPAPRLAGGHL